MGSSRRSLILSVIFPASTAFPFFGEKSISVNFMHDLVKFFFSFLLAAKKVAVIVFERDLQCSVTHTKQIKLGFF